MMLECLDLSSGYAGLPVLRDINLEVEKGEIASLVGANGAGKSTLLKTISGLLRPMSGDIRFEGNTIAMLSPAERVRLGIAHVPEGRQVFAGMTVEENLTLGVYARGVRRGDRGLSRRIDALGEQYPFLRESFRKTAGNLSGGQQQMLAIARGLMSEPSLIMLDEPSLGLSPLMVIEVFNLITQLREQGHAILLSEQNARAALAISDRGYVVESGQVTLSGAATELLASSEIAERYLGAQSATGIDEEEEMMLADRLKNSLRALDAAGSVYEER